MPYYIIDLMLKGQVKAKRIVRWDDCTDVTAVDLKVNALCVAKYYTELCWCHTVMASERHPEVQGLLARNIKILSMTDRMRA